MTTSARIGIRGRLFAAFGLVAMATVAAAIVAWISFTRLGDTLDDMAGRSVPAVTYAAELAEQGGGIIGTAQALAAAQNENERKRAWELLAIRLQGMNALLEATSKGDDNKDLLVDFRKDMVTLQSNLQHLNFVVRQRLERVARKEELSERLRWASADFLDEVEPMIDDTRFNINLALSRVGESSILTAHLENELARQRALFMINADGSLLAELIGRAENIPSLDALKGTELYFHEVESRINENFQTIEKVPGALSLRQSIKDILAFANSPQGLFQIRTQELADIESEKELLVKNQLLLQHLDALISERVSWESSRALDAAERSRTSIQQGRLWMTVAVFISVFVAIPVVWIYVGQGLVGRLRTLDESMRTIAEGDLNARVPVSGHDEIGEMANSLRTFRDTLSETQAELVQAAKLAALGQLTAGIAHEINQPLAAIRHYSRNTGLLVEKGRVDDARNNLDKITSLVEKANHIIEGLRALARKPKRDIRPTDMMSALNEALTLLEGRLRDQMVDVDMLIEDECRSVLAGQVRLEQVLINLINNAIDAMTNTPVRRMIISARRDKEWVELKLQDTGSGIAAEHIEQIFDPFFTTKDVGEGLGLGLSVSYNIIRDFGGNMRAESQDDKGATFWLRLKYAS
ncbi:MAG: ATP-binding protein [Candidatus Sedimenticola sp. 20ELBAFRAG]